MSNKYIVLAFITLGGYFGLLVGIGYVAGDIDGTGKILQLHEVEDGRYVVLDALYGKIETYSVYLRIRPEKSDKPKDYRIITTTIAREWRPGEKFTIEHGTPITDDSNS